MKLWQPTYKNVFIVFIIVIMNRLLIQMTITVATFWFGVNAVSFFWDPLTRPIVDAEQVTEPATPDQIVSTAPQKSALNMPPPSRTTSGVISRNTSIHATDHDGFVEINYKRFWSVREHPYYVKLPSAFRQLILENAKKKINTFYVARIDIKINDSTFVFWKEENVLILLEPLVGYDWKYVLVWSRRYWEYKKDVVPNAEVRGMSYKLTRAEWRKLVASCLRGDKFIFNQTRK